MRLIHCFRLVLVVCAFSCALPSQAVPQLLKDIDPSVLPRDSNPRSFVQIGNRVLFLAVHVSRGIELWSTDAAGTRVVYSGPVSQLTATGSHAYFVAHDSATGSELWKTDGTKPGTGMVKDVYPGPRSSFIEEITAVGSGVAFLALRSINNSREMWITDGTAAGTVPSVHAGSPRGLIAVGSLVFHVRHDNSTRWELWVFDDTNGTYRRVRSFRKGSGASPRYFTAARSRLFFVADDQASGELWESDGTTANTKTQLSLGSNLSSLCSLGNDVVFISNSDLFKADGTAVPTLLTDASTTVSPGQVMVETASGQVCFAATQNPTGTELWLTDGTGTAGTSMVADLATGASSSWPTDLRWEGGRLYFSWDRTKQFYSSDLTSAGTVQVLSATPSNWLADPSRMIYAGRDPVGGVEPITAGPLGQNPRMLIDINPAGGRGIQVPGSWDLGHIMLFATSSRGLWRTDGTTANTTQVHASLRVGESVVFRGALWFLDAQGRELWRSDGTPTGTQMLVRMTSVRDLRVLGSSLIFVGGTAAEGEELRIHDGVTVFLVTDLIPGPADAGIAEPVVVGSQLFFAATHPVSGRELFVSDGTANGTHMVTDLETGVAGSFPKSLTAFDGHCYFSASQAPMGRELFKSDGTIAGTVLVQDIYPGVGSSNPSELVAAGNKLYFDAQPQFAHSSIALHVWDGSNLKTSGQRTYGGGVPMQNGILLLYRHAAFGVEPGFTDGVRFGPLRDLYPGSLSSTARAFFVQPDQSLGFFSAQDGQHGQELWQTDTTAAGTIRITDLFPGPAGSDPRPIRVFAGRLWFLADDGGTGHEIWSIALGASATPIGSGCGPSPRLIGSTPRIGQNLILSGDPLPAGVTSFLALGLSPAAPVPLWQGCVSYVDFGRPHLIAGITPSTTPTGWSFAAAVPANANLVGSAFVAQAWFASSSGVLTMTNGLYLVCGR